MCDYPHLLNATEYLLQSVNHSSTHHTFGCPVFRVPWCHNSLRTVWEFEERERTLWV
jgi:hypothetical protein